MRLRLLALHLLIAVGIFAQTNPFATNTRVPVGQGPSALTVADFNGDGKKDIAVANQIDKTIIVLLGNGSGGFTNAPGSPIAMLPGQSLGPFVIAAGDFNSDGKIDLAYVENRQAESYSPALMVRFGVGDGTFLSAPGNVANFGYSTPARMKALDMNGDGHLDLAFDTPSDLQGLFGGYVLRGDGAGGFLEGSIRGNAEAADFNGDGRMDYVTTVDLGYVTVVPINIMIANASGSYLSKTVYPGTTWFGVTKDLPKVPQIRFTDFDQDGAVDILTLNSVHTNNIKNIQAWRGDGTGGAVSDFQHQFFAGNAYSLGVADFDGDGLEDWAVRTDSTIEIGLLRRPTNTAAPARLSIPIGLGPGDLEVADFNSDGKPDVVALNSGSNDLSLLLSGVASGATQTINFPIIPGMLANAAPFTISPSASSGLPVTVTSSSPAVCTILGNIVTIVGKGNCVLTATQAGNSSYQAAMPVSQSIVVTGVPQILTIAPISPKAVGSAPFTPQASSSSGLPVTVSISYTGSPTICTAANSVVTIIGPGTCPLLFTQAGDHFYNVVNATASFEITGTVATLQPQTLTFDPIADREESPNFFTISLTVSSGLAPTFASNTPTVCNVQALSLTFFEIKTISTGTCSLTASQDGAGVYTPVSITRTFSVTPPVKQAQNFYMPQGAPVSLASRTAFVPIVAQIAYTMVSNTPQTCSVISGHQVNLIAAGPCTVTATSPGNDYYLPAGPTSMTFNIVDGPTQAQTITFPSIPNYAVGTAPFKPTATTTAANLAVSFTSTTPSVCTVSANTVTLLQQGTCSIAADQAGNDIYLPAATVTRTFSVTAPSSAQAQTINDFLIPNHPLTDGSFTLNLAASSGLPVTLVSETPATCSVSGATVTLIALGQCTLTATQPGNATYQPAPPVIRSLNITSVLKIQSIYLPPSSTLSISMGSVTLKISATSGLPVTLTTTTPNYCSVTGYTVNLLATGECGLMATQVGDETYQFMFASTSVNITNATDISAQTLTFAPLPDRALGTGPFLLSASATSGLAPLFLTTTPDICSVSDAGALTLSKAGTCSITAYQNGRPSTSNGETLFAAAPPITHTFNISPGGDSSGQSQTINFPALADRTLSPSGVVLTATATSGLPVTFSSETPAVCTVNLSTVTLLSAGTCIVTASQAGDSNWAAASSVSRSFVVTSPAQAQTLTFTLPASVTRPVSTIQLTATITPGPGTIAYTSPTPDNCNISGTTLSINKSGTCSVTATATPTTPGAFQPISITRIITIAGPSQTITFAELPDRAYGSGNFNLTATASSGLAVTFTAVSGNACSISGNTVFLLTQGTCTITATQSGNATYDPAPSVSRSFQITAPAGTQLQSQTITFAPLPDRPVSAGPFTLSATASSGLAVSFSSSTPTTCTVQGTTLTPIAAGTCTISAQQPGNATYAAAPDISQSFTITAAKSSGPSIASVLNAAGYANGIAPESYVAVFGKNFGAAPQITLHDSTGHVTAPTLVYTSDTQINFVWPETALGAATVTVESAGDSANLSVTVTNIVPGLFSSNGTGQGPAAANVMIVNNDKSVTTSLVSDGPIPVLAGTDIYLVLYGTGIRGHSENGVVAKVAGRPVDVLYAGPQGAYPGLDQINLHIPLSVGGFGTVEIQLTVDGAPSNTVTANFQ